MTWRSKGTWVREVLDRTLMTADFWQSNIQIHELVRKDDELLAAAARIADQIGDFYQLVGQRMPVRKEREGLPPREAQPVDSRTRSWVVGGAAAKAVDAAFTLPDAGWIRMTIGGLTGDSYIRCSDMYDPFPDMVEWLEAICSGQPHAVWEVDCEGFVALLVYHADTQVYGWGDGARLIWCEAGHEVWKLSAMAVEPRALVEGIWRAFQAMVREPAYDPAQWEVALHVPAIDPDIFIDDLGDDDRCRMEQLWRAHPYGGWILHCLESEAIERFLAEPDPERGTLVERFRRRNWARRRAAD